MPDAKPAPPATLAETVAERTDDPRALAAAAAADEVLPKVKAPESRVGLVDYARSLGIEPEQIYIGGMLNPRLMTSMEDSVAERIRVRESARTEASSNLAATMRTRPDRPIEELARDRVAPIGGGSGGRGGAGGAISGVSIPGSPGRFRQGGAANAPGLPLGTLTYEASGGVEGTVLANRARARSDWKGALATTNPAKTRDTILAAQTGNPDLANLSDEIRAQKTGKSSWWSDLLSDGISHLEVLDYPRRAAWLGAVGLADILPESTGDAAGKVADLAVGAIDPVADYARKVTGLDAVREGVSALGAAAGDLWMAQDPEAGEKMAGIIRPLLDWGDSEHGWVTTPTASLPRLTDDDREAAIEQILPRLQRAAADGSLLRESNAHPGFLAWDRTKGALDATIGEEWAEVFMPGGRTRNITGRDLLNQGLPREEARRLAQDAFARGNNTTGALWTGLSTETGQELWGLALDVMLDPLWLAGPAAGSKIVHIGEEAWRLSRPALDVARRLEVGGRTWDEAARMVVRAVQGEAEARKLVSELAADAVAKSTKLSDEAAELRRQGPAGAVQTTKESLARMEQALDAAETGYRGGNPSGITQLRETVAGARKLVQQVESDPARFLAHRLRQLETAAETWKRSAVTARGILGGAGGKVVTQPGMLALHVPFGKSTAELGGAARRGLIDPLVAKVSGVVGDAARPYLLPELERRILDAPSVGSPWARARNALGPGELFAWTAQRATGRVLNFPRQVMRLLAMSLGTRFLEPAAMAASRWMSMWGKDAGATRYLLEHSGDIGKQISLPGVSREVWENYQESLGRFLDSIGSKDAFLKSQLMRIKAAAQQILRERRDLVRAGDPTVPPEWRRPDYDLEDIMAEAGNLIDEGAGELEKRPELAPLVDRFAALREELSGGPEGEALVQSYLRVVRSLEGSPERMGTVKALLDKAMQARQAEGAALEIEEQALEKLQRSADRAARLAQILAPEAREGLIRTLLRTFERDTPKPPGFRTSLGSTYTLHPDGTTTRIKAPHPGHSVADVGLKPRSEATYYVRDSGEIGPHGTLTVPDGRPVLIVRRGRGYLAVQRADGAITIAPSHQGGFELLTQPATGTHPLELWKVQGDTAKSWHVGNPIASIDPARAVSSTTTRTAAPGAFRTALILEIETAARRVQDPARRAQLLAGREEAADALLRELGSILGGSGAGTSPDEIARKLMRLAVAEADGESKTGSLETLLRKGLGNLAERAKKTKAAALDAMMDPAGRAAEKLADLSTRDRIVRLRVLLKEAEGVPALGTRAKALVEQAAGGDTTALARLTEHLGERKAEALASHWRATVKRTTGMVEKAGEFKLPDGVDPTGILGDSLDNLLRMVAWGKPLDEIQAASAKTVQALLEDAMRVGAGTTGGPRKLPAEWVARVVSEMRSSMAKTPRGLAWKDAVDAALRTVRAEIVARADETGDALVELEKSIATRKETVAALDVEIARYKQDFEAALVTVKAAPGESASAGNNLSTEGARRAATAWEIALWEKHQAITAGYTPEEGMLGAFSMLRDLESVPARAGDMGRRLGKLDDPKMVELTGAMRHLFDQYEEWYKAAGFGFVKDPIERMKMWGTVGYTPHIRVEAESVAKGTLAGSILPRGTTTTPRGVAATDGVLSTAMGARKQRQIAGTIAEINAAGTDVSMTLSLDRILTRYLASNGAVSAMDFMGFMVKGGVVQKVSPLVDPATGLVTKGVTEQALEAGLVPLFGRPGVQRDIDMLMAGSREDWVKAGVTPEELDAAIKILSTRKAGASPGVLGQIVGSAPPGAGPESPFASWLRQAPVAQANANIDGAVLAIRREGLLPGANPAAPLWNVTDALARHNGDWMQVAAELNAAATRNGLPHVGVEALEAYFTDQAWRLFVPGRVAESMTRIFEETKPTSELARVLKGGVDYVNSIYKTLLTIHTTSFSLRNFVGNTLSNMIDIGVHGAFSPQTNYDATRLYFAWQAIEKYGTLDAAVAAKSGWMNLPGVMDLWRVGFDLGDGEIRPAQEVLKILSEHEALSRAYTVIGDIGRFDEELAEGMVRSLREDPARWIKKNVVDPAPVGAMVLLSALNGAPGVVLPKKYGEQLARMVEGQSRLVNFLANVKRGGSFTEAGQHVQKFLFNYEDLTEFQKVWMRTLVPFFTWTQKNVMLHAEMVAKNPAYYQQFFQTSVHLESISKAMDRDAGFDYSWPVSTYDTTEQRMKNASLRSKVTIPIPAVLTDSKHPFLYLTGIGSPVEGAVDAVGMLGSLADLPAWINGSWDPARALSMMSWVLQIPAQWAMNRDFYYGKSLDELNNGARAVQWLTALEVGMEKADAVGAKPVAALYAALHAASREILRPIITLDPATGRESVKGEGRRLWLLNAGPWSAMLRKITASVDTYAVALTTDAGQSGNLFVAPDWVRFVNSISGLQVLQDDPWTNRERLEREILKAQEEKAINLGYGMEQEGVRLR